MKVWNGKALPGDWEATTKLDGVQVVVTASVARSRAGKPLYNLPALPDGTYECFLDDWSTSVSAVRTHQGAPIPVTALYALTPTRDPRLSRGWLHHPSSTDITLCYGEAIAEGHEGIVLWPEHGQPVKRKLERTVDAIIEGAVVGKGKHAGRLGALITNRGRVGTGFTDAERSALWAQLPTLYGMVIEVTAMESLASGKLRHPRFARLREDLPKASVSAKLPQ